MKSILRWSAILLLALARCGSDDENVGGQVDPALVASWEMNGMSVNGGAFFSPATIGWSFQIQFKSDKSFNYTEVWQGTPENGTGSWGVNGQQLTLRGGSYDWTGNYAVQGQTFSLSNVQNYDEQGHSGSFTFAKR